MNRLKQFLRPLLERLTHKEPTVENNQPSIMYTEEQLMARLKFFIGICLALTLFGIVFVVLYSLIFVTQPLNAISPIDQKFFELIIPIATFLTGTLSGIMLAGGDKDLRAKALDAANKAPTGGFGSGAATPTTTGFSTGATAFGSPSTGFGAAPGTSFTPAPSWGTTPTAPRSFSSAPLGAAAVGAVGGFAAATMMPAMDKPMPSRPPFDEDFPELD
jgi:hypothetical protein